MGKYEEEIEMNYKRIEAMYRNGDSIDRICEVTRLSKMQVLDATQKIFALDQRKKFRGRFSFAK